MNRCRDCAHWQREPFSGGHAQDNGFGTCKKAGSYEVVPEHPETLAYAADYEGFWVGLNTSPDFGCVMFEARGP